MTVLIFFLILLVLVVVHELGHFVVAKFFGVRVDEFGVGYPPRALSFGTWRGTEYTLNWLPFGGFVKIYGEDGEGISHSEKKESLAYKPWYAQIAVLSAGVIANVLLAFILFTYAASYGMAEEGSLTAHSQVAITKVLPDSPAALAGLLSNDRIVGLEVKGVTLTELTPSTISTFIQSNAGKTLTVTRERVTEEGKVSRDTLELVPVQGVHSESTKPAIGIAMGFVSTSEFPLWDSAQVGARETLHWLTGTVTGMWALLAGSVTGSSSLDDISGPVGIAGQVGSWYSLGFVYLAYFTAILSVNLAIINLIPIPALDGGRIVFVLYEALTRRRIPTRVAVGVNTIGFSLLLILMLVVTWSDIWKLVG